MTFLPSVYYTSADLFSSTTTTRLFWVFMLAVLAAPVRGDDVRPVQVQIREQEPGLFAVGWQVPKVIPLPATPVPVLPEGCEPEGERELREQPSTWIHRQVFRCDGSLSGQSLAIRYPFVNMSVSTLFRVSLLSGEEHARILAPGESTWELPAAPPDVLQVIQTGVITGGEHVLGEWVHVALVVAFVLVGSEALIGWFALGQVAAIVLSIFGISLASNLSEVGVAVAAAVLAREALRGVDERRSCASVAAACGLVHGLGLAGGTSGAGALTLAILGMDAVLLALGALATILLRGRAWSHRVAYGVGVVAVVLGLGLFFEEPSDLGGARSTGLPSLAGGSGGAGSQRIAPSSPEAPVQSFVAIEAFETRHEVLVRVAELWSDDTPTIAVEDQADVKERIAATIVAAAEVVIDGTERESMLDRVDFVTVDAQGVLPRAEPIPEDVANAFIGVTVVYPTRETPSSLTMTWSAFEPVAEIPTTVIDPETTRTALLTADAPAVEWTNELSEDPIPTVSAVSVEPRTLALPIASVPLLALAVWCFVKKRTYVARVAFVAALVVAPFGAVAVALPASSVPSSADARRILASLLPNVYRAFEFREESAAYDRLAVSVTGDTLTEVYLEHRRALEMEERGGARARVEAVEVQTVEEVAPGTDEGFDAVALWTVGGTVTHFGHRHFRENRYRASVTVVPVDDHWKIRSIEVLQEERVR